MRRWFIKRLAAAALAEHIPAQGDPEAFLAMARAESFVFTTTELFYAGSPRVTQYFTVEDQTEATRDRVLGIAGSLGAASGATLLSAVEFSALEEGLILREAEADLVSEVGVTGKIDRSWYVLGDEAALALEDIDTGLSVQALARQIERDGAYVLYLGQVQPRRLLGVFACSYQVDPMAIEQVKALKKMGVEPILLSTARANYVKAVAKALGITHMQSDLTQEERDEVITEFKKKQPVLVAKTETEIRLQVEYRGQPFSLTVGSLADLCAVMKFAKTWEKRGRKLLV